MADACRQQNSHGPITHSPRIIACVCFNAVILSTMSFAQSPKVARDAPFPSATAIKQDKTNGKTEKRNLPARQDNRSADDFMEVGLLLAQTGDLTGAIENLEAAAKLKPGPATFYNLGVAYGSKAKLDRGRQDEVSYKKSVELAIAAFQRAVEYGLDTMEVHNNLGLVYQQNGERVAARREFEKSITKDPKSAEPHNNLGILLTYSRQLNAAIMEYRKAIELEPQLFPAHVNLIRAMQAKGALQPEIERYRTELLAQPRSGIARCHLGYLLLQTGQIEAAKTELHTALETLPRFAVAHYFLGQVLEREGDYTTALYHYRTAASLAPDQATVRSALGNALLQQGQVEDAVQELRVATDLDPNSTAARYGLARALLRIGKTEEARRLFAQVNMFKDTESGTQRAALEINQAIDFAKKGDAKRAIPLLESAARIQPNLPEAHYVLGIALAQADNFERANEEFRTALELSPHDPHIYFNYAVMLWRQGKLSDAAEALRQVIRLEPDNGKAHCYLAQLLLKLQDTRNAEVHFKRARELGFCEDAAN